MKGGDEYVVWGICVDTILEPPNRSGEAYGGVKGFRVGDMHEDP